MGVTELRQARALCSGDSSSSGLSVERETPCPLLWGPGRTSPRGAQQAAPRRRQGAGTQSRPTRGGRRPGSTAARGTQAGRPASGQEGTK